MLQISLHHEFPQKMGIPKGITVHGMPWLSARTCYSETSNSFILNKSVQMLMAEIDGKCLIQSRFSSKLKLSYWMKSYYTVLHQYTKCYLNSITQCIRKKKIFMKDYKILTALHNIETNFTCIYGPKFEYLSSTLKRNNSPDSQLPIYQSCLIFLLWLIYVKVLMPQLYFQEVFHCL